MADRQPDLPNATYLGFDFGEKKTGVAVGQRITGTARGLDTIRNTSQQAFWCAVSKLVETWQPSAFVVGIPIPSEPNKDPQNPIVPLIKTFCSELEQRYQRPVHTMDETLSTRESQTLFYSQRVRKSVQFTDIKDELAAQLILQTWLSHTQPRATE